MSRNMFKRYFQMLGRETALPAWARKRDANINNEADDGVDSLKKGAIHTTAQSIGSDSLPPSPDIEPNCLVNDTNIYIDESEGAKSKNGGLGKYWAIMATGAGLFSDGYVNNNTGTAITMLETIYTKEQYSASSAMQNLASIAFVGTVVGMLVFGLVADYWSRKGGMIISTLILIAFSILAAGSWGIGAPSNPKGMLDMLIVCRALVGVGIGGEYPAGSVACAEVSQRLGAGTRNRWFIWFTDFMIDFGFVISSFVAWLLMYICSVPKYAEPGNSHGLQAAWRILLGLGAIPPLSLLYLRFKFEDDEQFTKNNFKKAKTPWWLIIKRYSPRLVLVSVLWFLYDWSGYGFSTYSSMIIKSQVPVNEDGIQNIKTAFGWNVVFNLFYLPGSFLGGYCSDYLGPRMTLFIGVLLQGIVGFIMGAKYFTLKEHIAGLVVAYGIFSTLGEFGPGDNIGLICSKTSASSIRGRYYAIAAAVGKLGAFVSNYVFPSIAANYGGIKSDEGQQVLVYVSASMCLVAALLSLFLPEISQESVALEDIRFRNYLAENGYDPHQMDNIEEEQKAFQA